MIKLNIFDKKGSSFSEALFLFLSKINKFYRFIASLNNNESLLTKSRIMLIIRMDDIMLKISI